MRSACRPIRVSRRLNEFPRARDCETLAASPSGKGPFRRSPSGSRHCLCKRGEEPWKTEEEVSSCGAFCRGILRVRILLDNRNKRNVRYARATLKCQGARKAPWILSDPPFLGRALAGDASEAGRKESSWSRPRMRASGVLLWAFDRSGWKAVPQQRCDDGGWWASGGLSSSGSPEGSRFCWSAFDDGTKVPGGRGALRERSSRGHVFGLATMKRRREADHEVSLTGE